jgi:hypothetical protein
METKDLTKELADELTNNARKLEKLHTLKVMDVCLQAIWEKEVTIKYEGDDKTHIYIGGEYFQTLPGSQWAKIVQLVVDVAGKAYSQGANDVVKDILTNLK